MEEQITGPVKLVENKAGENPTPHKEKITAILAGAVTAGFFGVLAAHVFLTIPDANKPLLSVMLGALGTAWISAMQYFFGSSSGSKNKDSMIASKIRELK